MNMQFYSCVLGGGGGGGEKGGGGGGGGAWRRRGDDPFTTLVGKGTNVFIVIVFNDGFTMSL